MKTLISVAGIRLLTPLFVIFSLYLLYRGHNEPGGGFIGGLIGCIGFVFHAMIHGPEVTAKKYRLRPISLIATGLLLASLSSLISLLIGLPFMTAIWVGGLGTPILFDIGVYLLVIGITLQITFILSED
jgi:multicomponent Na+:H+ antiporter subunit B